MLIKYVNSKPSPGPPNCSSHQVRSVGAFAELSAPRLLGENCFPTRPGSSQLQLWFLPQQGYSCRSLYLSDNNIAYLMGSSGWFLFYVLQEFSISLSPPPSADENDGVHDSNCRGTFPSFLRTSEKRHRGWPETRVTASPPRGDQR